MKIEETSLSGVFLCTPQVFSDNRGYFFESFQADEYARFGISGFVQDNESFSKKGVLRGLHYQLSPYAQGKLVRVLFGEVLDVAVDIRPSSKTFGKWISVLLSGENKKQLWIPPGFAHGFLTLSETALFSYKCTQNYQKESERGILWNDADIAIDWGIKSPLLSEKDAKNVPFTEAKKEMKFKKA